MSSDLETIEKILNSKLIEKAYNDLCSTPLQETSKLITYFVKTLQLACVPFQYTAAWQERLEKRLKISIEKVPEENRIKPPDSLSVPIILENAVKSYCVF